MHPVRDTYLDSAFRVALLRYVYNLVKPFYLLLRVYVCVFSHSITSYSLQPYGLQDARLPCLVSAPWACSSSRSLRRWYHPIISACRPRLSLPSNFPSIRIFSNESVLCIQWPKYWRFSISLFSEYSGLISFRVTYLISLLSKGLSRVFFNTKVKNINF